MRYTNPRLLYFTFTMVNVVSNEIQNSCSFGRYIVDMLTPAEVTGNGNTEISRPKWFHYRQLYTSPSLYCKDGLSHVYLPNCTIFVSCLFLSLVFIVLIYLNFVTCFSFYFHGMLVGRFCFSVCFQINENSNPRRSPGSVWYSAWSKYRPRRAYSKGKFPAPPTTGSE